MDKMEAKHYPSIGQSIGLTGLIILVMLMLSPIVFLKEILGTEATSFIYYFVAMGLSFWIVFSIWKSKVEDHSFKFTINNKKVIPLVLLGTIGIQYALTLPISSLIPMSEEMMEIFKESIGNPRNIFAFITLVVLAPILEELIFRGIILRGLLNRYSPFIAIVLSSTLFGIVHLNPWQFVSAFFLGIFIGWVYSQTKSISLSIIIHAFNNFMASLPMILWPKYAENSNESLREILGSDLIYALIIAGAAIIATVCIFYLYKTFKQEAVESTKIWDKPVNG
jgi:membrane protease YdiL (CAAX protease family)